MLAPPGFPPLHYLNKPVLPGMALEQNGGAPTTNGGLEAYTMPELLASQQNGTAGGPQQNGSHTNGNASSGGHGGRHNSPSSNTTTSHKPPKPHSDLRLFKCLTCGKDFKQKSTLLQHDRIHTDARPYPCSECGKRFRQQSHLTQHLRIHANEKPFTCAYCSRSFRQRAILNQHIRIHSGEKPFACPECGKHFRQKAILNQHVRTHQGERQLLTKTLLFIASFVPFKIKIKSILAKFQIFFKIFKFVFQNVVQLYGVGLFGGQNHIKRNSKKIVYFHIPCIKFEFLC